MNCLTYDFHYSSAERTPVQQMSCYPKCSRKKNFQGCLLLCFLQEALTIFQKWEIFKSGKCSKVINWTVQNHSIRFGKRRYELMHLKVIGFIFHLHFGILTVDLFHIFSFFLTAKTARLDRFFYLVTYNALFSLLCAGKIHTQQNLKRWETQLYFYKDNRYC